MVFENWPIPSFTIKLIPWCFENWPTPSFTMKLMRISSNLDTIHFLLNTNQDERYFCFWDCGSPPYNIAVSCFHLALYFPTISPFWSNNMFNINLILQDDLLFYSLMVQPRVGIPMPSSLESKVGFLPRFKCNFRKNILHICIN